MFFTRIRYRWMEETSKHLVNYDEEIEGNALMGMLDSNIDGKIEKSELKAQSQVGGMLLKNWDAIDKNHDGAIDKTELAAATKTMFGHHRQEASAAPAAAAPTGGK
jgi:Ca2+-binding EF-hand superfamily protein